MKMQTVRIAYVGLSDIQDSVPLISTHHYVRNFTLSIPISIYTAPTTMSAISAIFIRVMNAKSRY